MEPMERAYNVMMQAALPILGRSSSKRTAQDLQTREETWDILSSHWLETAGVVTAAAMDETQQKKRRRHTKVIHTLRKKHNDAVDLMLSTPESDRRSHAGLD